MRSYIPTGRSVMSDPETKPEKRTKEKIMEAAVDLFSEEGYDKVSINRIAEKAGVSKGGIFHHFESKYTLARDSLMWWAYENLSPDFHMGDPDYPPKKILIGFIDFMMELISEDGQFTRFFWSVFDESIRRREDTSVWVDFLNEYVTSVEKIYERMGAKDPRMKAMIFLSNLDGIALYHSLIKESGMEFDIDQLRDELVRTYVNFKEGER